MAVSYPSSSRRRLLVFVRGMLKDTVGGLYPCSSLKKDKSTLTFVKTDKGITTERPLDKPSSTESRRVGTFPPCGASHSRPLSLPQWLAGIKG